jgi:hypothetical protein
LFADESDVWKKLQAIDNPKSKLEFIILNQADLAESKLILIQKLISITHELEKENVDQKRLSIFQM